MPGFRKRFKYDGPWEVIKAVCPLKQSMEEDYNGIKARGQETVLLARHQRMGKPFGNPGIAFMVSGNRTNSQAVL